MVSTLAFTSTGNTIVLVPDVAVKAKYCCVDPVTSEAFAAIPPCIIAAPGKKYPEFATHDVDPAAEPELAMQFTHAVAPKAVENVLAGQSAQAVVLPSAENVPGAQVWHAVDVPSTKNCPALQHTAVPVGEHLSVWPVVHEPVHGIFIMF
jgi:hypothetical protein